MKPKNVIFELQLLEIVWIAAFAVLFQTLYSLQFTPVIYRIGQY